MKLHLGCGQKYLDGYCNIDYPIYNHSVQTRNISDISIDITSLQYNVLSIDEIRLHHVFEHFIRPIACALVASWRSWLKVGGILHIEVPDLTGSIIDLINPFRSIKKKMITERHLFGSHEANWANHLEAYSIQSLKFFIMPYGFKIVKTKHARWLDTKNIEIWFEKTSKEFDMEMCSLVTRQYLSSFLLDDSNGEKKLLEVWMEIYHEQFKKSYGKYE